MEDFNIVNLTQDSLMNRLFCSFSKKDELDFKLEEIIREYKILYNKIFVLASPESDEYLCTYNIEIEGTMTRMMHNTILLHRKKETNTLYTINALNSVIKYKNQGVLDSSYQINWQDYKNSVLLTQPDESLRKLNTIIHKIVNL
jgi:hypothetical protein